ncbi:MAG TPA: response regulator transcription factor, partial [Chloroflexota bacterium]|nr:response regulator transcription factor [Chloroflexota bacterium]
MSEIRILLCEDQTIVRDGLRTILSLQGDMEVVGEAADGEEAVERALELSPDIILMDIQMPRRSGVEATALITAARPDVRVIVLTTFDNDDYVFDAIKAGAMGYLLKDVPAVELIEVIRRVHAGESFIQPQVASRLLIEFGRRARPAPPGRSEPPQSQSDDLTEREHEVLVLLAEGRSNRDIGAALFLAESTVKNHVSNILGKLHAANRTHAVTLAREQGLV